MRFGTGRWMDRIANRYWFAAAMSVLVIAAGGCGGGGGGGGGGNYTLSGTITAPAGIVIDSDVNDPNEDYVLNDSIATAQPIPNPVTVGGYVNVAESGPAGSSMSRGDREDYFRVDLKEDDSIFLSIGNHLVGDLDLYLYNSSGAEVSVSTGVDRWELLHAPVSGTYFVNVYAHSGASNYVLTIGSRISNEHMAILSTEHDFVPGDAIVRFADTPGEAGSMRALSDRATGLGMRMAAGGPDRAVLMTFEEGYQRSEVFRSLGIEDKKKVGGRTNSALQRKLDTLQVIKALRQRPDVVSADPNYIVQPYLVPSDTYYTLQWHYPLINLPLAWGITTGTGTSDVVVAVVDTGVLMNHPDLAGKLTSDGYDFIRDTYTSRDEDGIDPNPDDPGDSATPGASSFHGTHCAGTVAAASNNGRGVAGVSWGAKIMPIRVLGRGGGTLYDILQGVRYAAGLPNDSEQFPNQRADIISMSLGGGGYSASAQTVFTQVRNQGVILIAAAGNEASSTPSYPASYEGVISVSAVGINSTRASYSNYGAYIDVAAPGGDSGDLNGDGYQDLVLSTCGNDSSGTIVFNYALQAGTSMATPHVAGVAALMKAVRPGLTPDELDAWLQAGLLTTDIGAPGRDNYYGHGLIDAYKAVLTARQDTDVTLLKVDPPTLNFGPNATTATLTVSKLGSGNLSVESFTPGAAWLSISAGSVDPAGFGVYTVTATRNSLSNGSHTSTIVFTAAPSGDTVTVPVNIQVNTTSGSANAGFHYVLLLDPDTYATIDQYDVAAGNGIYSYTFTGVLAGTYLIFAGSDRDNDMFIDNPGESLGAYNSLDYIAQVTVSGSRSDLNFSTNLLPLLPAAGTTVHAFDEGRQPSIKRIR